MRIKNTYIENNGPFANPKLEKAEAPAAGAAARADAGATAKVEAGGDTVTLSEEARLRNLAMQTATESPDVRADKVAAIKARIKAGTYVPDSGKIAEKLLRDDLDLLV